MKTQKQVRESFWNYYYPNGIPRGVYKSKRQNKQPADIRMAFVDYVDMLSRDGTISEQLAQRVTL
jgi:hypothetical protein